MKAFAIALFGPLAAVYAAIALRIVVDIVLGNPQRQELIAVFVLLTIGGLVAAGTAAEEMSRRGKK